MSVAIIGAGPCGIAAAVALKDAGIPAVVYDRGEIVNSIENYPTNLTFFSTPEKLVIGDVPFACAGTRPTRREGVDYYRAVAATHALDVRTFHDVRAVARDGAGFRLDVARPAGPSVAVHASAIVVATGYFDYPNMLGVPGEDLPHVSHRFVDAEGVRDADVVVVGGGNSAVEAAMELVRGGARVTLVHYEEGFVSHVIKPWIYPAFEAMVARGEIVLRWRSRVVAIGAARVTVRRDDGAPDELPARRVYLMTGYTPRPGLLGALGVPFDEETGIPAHDPATMETTVPGVFVAGVLVSGKKANGVFIENGRGHGALIAAALRGRGVGDA